LELEQDGDLVLTVSDDGLGFDAAAIAGGLGLASIRERAEALGGKVGISSTPGEGSQIRVTMPAGAMGEEVGEG
jgi:signal transduction histidine kinase